MAIITIGGQIGAGKTVLSQKLAIELGYEELYVGGIFREIAAERGLHIDEFYAQLKTDPKLEQSIDERQAKLMQEKDNLVVQGRVAWFFAKGSLSTVFNIFLAVSPEAGAVRSGERTENAGIATDELIRMNESRHLTEVERYRNLYDIDNFLDPGHYDYVLDTSELTEQEVLDTVLQKIKDRLEGDV